MLGRLDGAFQAQRTLVEDVSHELRNPVAVIQANVEAVLGSEQSTPPSDGTRPRWSLEPPVG